MSQQAPPGARPRGSARSDSHELHYEAEPAPRRSWALKATGAALAMVLLLGAGAYAGRALFPAAGSKATTTGDRLLGAAQPSTTPAAGGGADAAPAGAPPSAGTATGMYTLRGPTKAPAGSWAVLTLTGLGQRIVKVDTSAPFRAVVDTRTLKNGIYTLSVMVMNPRQRSWTDARLITVANPGPSKAVPSPASPANPATNPGAGPMASPAADPTPKAAPKPNSAGQPPAAPSGGGGTTAGSTQAAEVVTLTNQEREKAGCAPLTVDAALTGAAVAHSADMAARGYFAHESQDGRSPFQRMTSAGYRYRMAAENIAMGQATAAAVMAAWMTSAGHRANILNCGLTQIGVGYATNAQGTPYWTQDFGTPA